MSNDELRKILTDAIAQLEIMRDGVLEMKSANEVRLAEINAILDKVAK